METTALPIVPYLQTLVDRDNQLYLQVSIPSLVIVPHPDEFRSLQEQKRHGRSSRSADMSDVTEPYLRNTGCKDQSPDRGPPCIF